MQRILQSITPRGVMATVSIVLVVVLLCNTSARLSKQHSERPWSPETCLEVLLDTDPLLRSYAIDDLLLAPENAVDYVVQYAHKGDERAVEVAMGILVEFIHVDDREVQAKAIDALLELRESEIQATSIVARQHLLSLQRQVGDCCCEALEAKGAIIHRFAVFSSSEEYLVPGAVVFGPGWRGSREELDWVRRLPRSPRLYLVDGDELDPADQEYLRGERPDLVIRRRGRACLGVIFRGGMHIYSITPNSPAELAGIEPASQLVSLDGQLIRDFEHLIDLMVDCQPGQIVQLTINHQGELREVPLQLGSDVEAGICECANGPVASTAELPLDRAQPTPVE